MAFVRFVIQTNDPNSGRRQGLFQALAELEERGVLRPHERRTCAQAYEWFRRNLRKPRSFARSSKPRAKNVAVSWFKDTALRHIQRMWAIAEILKAHGIAVQMIRTDRPGYVVYEDEYQVTAEPFGDTGA